MENREKAQEEDRFRNDIRTPLVLAFGDMSGLGKWENRVKGFVEYVVTTVKNLRNSYSHISPEEALDIMFDEIHMLSNNSFSADKDEGDFRETIYKGVAHELAKEIPAGKPAEDGDKEVGNMASGVSDEVRQRQIHWPEI